MRSLTIFIHFKYFNTEIEKSFDGRTEANKFMKTLVDNDVPFSVTYAYL